MVDEWIIILKGAKFYILYSDANIITLRKKGAFMYLANQKIWTLYTQKQWVNGSSFKVWKNLTYSNTILSV